MPERLSATDHARDVGFFSREEVDRAALVGLTLNQPVVEVDPGRPSKRALRRRRRRSRLRAPRTAASAALRVRFGCSRECNDLRRQEHRGDHESPSAPTSHGVQSYRRPETKSNRRRRLIRVRIGGSSRPSHDDVRKCIQLPTSSASPTRGPRLGGADPGSASSGGRDPRSPGRTGADGWAQGLARDSLTAGA